MSVPLKFTNVESAPVEKNVEGEGTTADVSREGMGFFSDKELTPGTVLEIECSDIWALPQQFTVKWCDRIQYNFFRMGLEIRSQASHGQEG